MRYVLGRQTACKYALFRAFFVLAYHQAYQELVARSATVRLLPPQSTESSYYPPPTPLRFAHSCR